MGKSKLKKQVTVTKESGKKKGAQKSSAENIVQKLSEKKTPKIRARKLFHPFMNYLRSYDEFAKALPKTFMRFDEEKFASKSDEEEKSDDEEKSVDDEKERKTEDEETKAKSVTKTRGPQFGSATRAKSISELKERLANLKGKRLEYQDRLKKKGLKNRLTKKQKLEERAKLKKERLKKAKQTKGNLNKPKISDGALTNKVVDVKPKIAPKLMFGKLDVPEEDKGHQKKVNKDPKRALQKIEKSQAKLKELEEKGRTETVKRIKEKLTWDKAIQKAEGVKLKDDVELLKKTIRKKSELKKHSTKKWDNRLEGLEKRKKEGQTKRRENIAKKIKEKKQKKVKRSIKKGRVKL